MAELDLLDFFKTGTLSGVIPGMTRLQVRNLLGHPDGWYRDKHNSVIKRSGIWVYAGIELTFHFPWIGYEDVLTSIYFRTGYLFREWYGKKFKTKLRRWIFRNYEGPTIPKLLDWLSRHQIPYQDTGLEMLIWDEDNKHSQVVEFQEEYLQKDKKWNGYEVDEFFGTIVLKSGIQIRYDEKSKIIRVTRGGDWMIKGKEALIRWDEQSE